MPRRGVPTSIQSQNAKSTCNQNLFTSGRVELLSKVASLPSTLNCLLILYTAWSTNYDLNSFTKDSDLTVDRLTTIYGNRINLSVVFCKFLNFSFYLNSKLTSRAKNDCLWLVEFRID